MSKKTHSQPKVAPVVVHLVVRERMTKAFNEWMRRYTEEPEKFGRDWQTVAVFLAEQSAGREPTCGEAAAAYFTQLLEAIPLT